MHSTFLYRRGHEKFNPFLSPAAHREETLFTYGLKRQGFRILVDTAAVTWHFRDGQGGIRSHTNPQFWADDERLFQSQLAEWGVTGDQTKYIVLDAGRGDHVSGQIVVAAVKREIPETCRCHLLQGRFQRGSRTDFNRRSAPAFGQSGQV